MTMLPDIDQDSYDLYERERAAREMDQRLSTFTLEHSMDSRIAGLSALAPTSSDSLTNPLGTGNAPAPPPEPAAPPPPVVEQPTEQLPPPPAPEPAPVAPVATAPAPATDFAAGPRGMLQGAPSPGGGGLTDWIAQSASAVGRSGGDVGAFLNNLKTSGGDIVGNAIGAAHSAGADLQTFASGLTAPPQPAAPTSAGGISAPSGAAPLPQGDLVDYARQQARRYGIDEDVFVRQIQQESGFKNTARSGAGAIGIAQFMPGTAQGMGIDPTDPYQALEGAARLNAQNLQRYGGDYSKMLAAYNAGGGAVDKYGGVPPFEETQRYVSTILGGVKGKIGGAASALGGAVRGGLNQISQFGDSQLTADEAYSACGPAAAVRFAQLYGRNPTLREATDLAKTVGWTSGSGMAGLTSEAALMAKMGVPVKMVGADWQVMAREAQSGNPVTISTPGHYFTADGYDPSSGAFHVGRSGTDLRGGSEWMTPAQMEARMGKVQGGLLADNPGVPSPSIAEADSNPVSYLGRMKDTLTSSITDGGPALTDVSGKLTSAATGRPDDLYMGGMQAASVGEPTALPQPTPEAPQSPGDRLKSAFSDFIDSVGGAKDAVGSALGGAASNAIASPGGGLPAASQPTPSDSLTNPLGYKPAQSDILPRIESAVAENQANPPLKPFADELAKQPVTLPGQVPLPGNLTVGDVVGAPILRGPMLQSTEDLLRSREGTTARSFLEEARQAELAKGLDSPPVTDAEVAEAARTLMIGQAVAGTHTGEGLSPSALARRAPRASEGAVPATGAGQMAQAFDQLSAYPAWVRSGIEDFVGKMGDAPPSEVASTVYKWMQENPLATVTDHPGMGTLQQMSTDLENLHQSTAIRSGGVQPEKGQLGFEDSAFGRGAQPLLPESGGEFQVPDYGPRGPSLVERIRAWREQRAGTRPIGPEEIPATQAEMPGFIPPDLELPHYVPKSMTDVLQRANQAVRGRTTPIDDAFVEDLAAKAGVSPDRIRKVWKPDVSDESHATLRALDRAVEDSTTSLGQLNDTLKADPTNKEAIADVVRGLTHHQALQEVLERKPPEAGSILGRMGKTLAGDEETTSQINRMARRFKMTGEEFAQHVSEQDLNDPAVVNNLAKVGKDFNFGDKLGAMWYFAMLSSPKTHLRNIVGNFVTGAARPLESAGASAFDPLARRMLGETGPRQRFLGEAREEAFGAATSTTTGLRQAWRALTEGWVPERMGEYEQFSREPFRGTRGAFIGAPGRGLQAEDTFFRALNEGATKNKLAFRQAKQEGLQGQALRDRIADIIKTPDDVMQKTIQDEGSYRVFQNESKFASRLNQAREDYPVLRYLFPFTRTPINMAKYAGERSPLALLKIANDFRTVAGREGLQKAGSGALSDRMSRAGIGTAAWSGLFMYAKAGNLTGAAPTDPAERDAFYRDGKQPYSFKRPGSDDWISYQALSPFSMLFSTAADTADAYNRGRLEGADLRAVVAAMGVGIGHAMVDQQWTSGLADVLDAFGGGGPGSVEPAKVENWIERQAGGLVPAVLRDSAHVVDNVVRDPTNPVESVLANIPFASKSVPARLNAFGGERTRDSGPGALLNPFPMTSETDNPVELALQDLQKKGYKVEPGLVGKNATVLGQDVDLTDDQRQRYQRRSGALSWSLLSGMVGSDEWNDMSDGEKAKYVSSTISDIRKAVREDMTPEMIRQARESYERLQKRRAGQEP